jgi:hypothetical protein
MGTRIAKPEILFNTQDFSSVGFPDMYKAKFTMCLIKHNDMKSYGGVDV